MRNEAKKLDNEVREAFGHGLIERLETTYKIWKENPNKTNAQKYLTWRLRARVKMINNPEFLVRLNSIVEVGLFDEEVGPLFDKIDPSTIDMKHRTGIR
jgi:hypothetical protein